MGDGFASYIGRMELLAFFSGYPLIYSLVRFIAGKRATSGSPGGKWKKLTSLLPYVYAFTGLLYLGLELKNAYPAYTLSSFRAGPATDFLRIWALLSLLFWIPALAKKPQISLLHSLVFFCLLLKDILLQSGMQDGREILRNDMIIYSLSLLLNSAALGLVSLLTYLISLIPTKTPGA